MKKTALKTAVSVFLMVALLLGALSPITSFLPEEFKIGAIEAQAATVSVDGTPANSLDAVYADRIMLNGLSDLSSVSGTATLSQNTDRTIFGDGNGIVAKFASSAQYIDIDTSGLDSYKGIAAISFAVYNASGSVVHLTPYYELDGDGTWRNVFSTDVREPYYIIHNNNQTFETAAKSIVGGQVYINGTMTDYITQTTTNWSGNIIMPINLGDDFDYSRITAIRLQPNSGKTLVFNDVTAIYNDSGVIKDDVNLNNIGVTPSSDLTYRPVVEIPHDATTANIMWNAVENATKYTVSLFSLADGKTYEGSYLYNAGTTSNTNSAVFSGLVPGQGYAVQIKAIDSTGKVFSVSELKEFVAKKRGNYNLINDLSAAESVNIEDAINSVSIFENISVLEDDTVFPDGKGLKLLALYRRSIIGFKLDDKVDISQFEGFSHYAAFSEGSGAYVSFRDWTDQDGNKITNLLYQGSNGDHFAIYSAKTGVKSTANPSSVKDTGSVPCYRIYQANHNKSYAVLNNAESNEKHLVSSVNMNTTYGVAYTANNLQTKLATPFCLDNLAVIDNLNFLNAEEFGLLSASTNSTPTVTASTVSYNGASISLAWNAITNASTYSVNIYRENDGVYTLQDSVTGISSSAKNYTANLDIGNSYAVQVVGKKSDGTIVGSYKPVYLDTTEYLPDILGATFNENNSFRFAGLAPAKIFTNCTVKGYGIVMIPVKLLNGDLNTSTKYAAVAEFNSTPALNSEFYGILKTSNFNLNSKISARSFIVYSDGTNDFTVYSDTVITRSIADISRNVAETVLTYKTAKDKTVWTSAVSAGTKTADIANIAAADIREFALKNMTAASDAYGRLLIDADSTSRLADRGEFAYVYEGDGYTYGITQDFEEIISYKTDENRDIDIMKGAGEYNIIGTANSVTSTVYKNAGVSQFSQKLNEDGTTSLTVTYQTTGVEVDGANMSTTYTFRENGINIKAAVKYSNSDYNLESSLNSDPNSSNPSLLSRKFVATYKDCDRIWNPEWIYPDNGDYPYRETESFVWEYKYADNLYVFNFLRGENVPAVVMADGLDKALHKNHIYTYFKEGTAIDYVTEYDLVMFQSDKDATSVREKALFAGLNSNYSAKILVDDNTNQDQSYISSMGNGASDNTAIFTGDKVDVSVKLTGLKETSLPTTVTYSVYHHSGVARVKPTTQTVNLVNGESVTFDLITLNNITNAYGMYYINLTVSSSDYTYTEYLPIMLAKDVDFSKQNMLDNPFGISQFLSDDEVPLEDQWAIVEKLGVAKNRSLFMRPSNDANSDYSLNPAWNRNYDFTKNIKYLEKMKQAGVMTTMLAGSSLPVDDNLNDNIYKGASALIEYAEYFHNGNEINLSAFQKMEAEGDTSIANKKEEYPRVFSDSSNTKNYLDYYYTPAKTYADAVGVKLATEGISFGDTTWFDLLNGIYPGDTVATGENIWNNFDAIDMHCYSQNVPQFNPLTSSKSVWSIEAALKRTRAALDKYGDKTLIIGETGCWEGANNLTKQGIRLQSEFNTQAYALCAAYGADWISTYCAFDFASYTYGTSVDYRDASVNETRRTTMELHYGAFYYPDYYGRVLPKPAAASFANMTRMLEGYVGAREATSADGVTLSTKSSTTKDGVAITNARAFKFTLKDNPESSEVGTTHSVYVAWSIAGLSYTSTGINRKPLLPWQTDWSSTTSTDTVTIETNSSSVKVYDIMGNYKTINASNGTVTVPLTGSPCYIVEQ